uniref:Uncharacterized protein n=1 Tax=Mola mola TaxID=94237 RepID=A0A3Q3WBE6_MOLML
TQSKDNKSSSFSKSLLLDDSEKGVVITGITDDTVAAKSGDEIVAATIHLDRLNKNEVLQILKVLEPYDDNVKVVTKKELSVDAGLGLDAAQVNVTWFYLCSSRFDHSTVKEVDGNGDRVALNLKKDLSLDASAKAPFVSFNSQGRKLNTDISGPTLNGDLPNLSPAADANAKFTVPSLGLTGPEVKGDLDGTLKAPDVSVSAPRLNTPGASLDTENQNIKAEKYKCPRFTMPHFGLPQIKPPKAEMDVDFPSGSGNLDTPEYDPKVELKVPDLHINGPKVDSPEVNFENPNLDIEAPSGKFKWPHHKWKGPKLKGPDGDLNADLSVPEVNLSTPQIKGDVGTPDFDVNILKADIKGPDLDVTTPNLDIDAPSGKINWPHLKWNKPKLHGPKADLDLDANLNTPDVPVPNMEGEINAPDVDIHVPNNKLKGPDLNMQTPDIDIEAPSGKINWPHLKWKKPKDLSTPKIEGEMNVPNAELDFPEDDLGSVDIQGPNIDTDAPSGKINWPHLKWKKPRLHGPKADYDLNADVGTPDIDLSVPKVDGEINTPDVDLNLPKADINVKTPNADIEPPSGKFKWPTLKKPKWTVSGPKVNGPDVDLDADVPAPDLSLSTPKIDGEVNAPDVNLSLPKGDFEGPNFDINAPDKPKFGTLKGPKADIDTDMKVPVDVKAPNVDLNAPDFNLSAPKIDSGIEGAGVNVNMPNVDVKSPDIELNGPDAKVNLPKLKLPTFKGPKVKGPEWDADLKAPDIDASPNVDLKAPNFSLIAPKIEGSCNAPDLDINLPGADVKVPDVNLQGPDIDAPVGKFKWFNFKKPKFGTLKGPKADIDTDVKVPDVDVKAPNVDLNVPDFDLSAPKIDTDLVDSKLDLPKLELPTFKGPKVKGLELDAKLNAPDIDASSNVDLKAPNLSLSAPKIEGSCDVPDLDINLPEADLRGPDVDLQTPEVDAAAGIFKLPHIKLPKVNSSGPKVKGPNLTVDSPDVDFDLPNADVQGESLDLPKADVRVSDLKLNAPDLSLSSPKINGNLSASNVDTKFPKYAVGVSLHLSLISVPAKDLSLPNVEGDIKGPKIDMKAATVDASTEKSKLPHLKFPKLNFSGSNIKAPDVDSSANLDVLPDVKVNAPSVEGEISSPHVSVSAPEVRTSLNTPELDFAAGADAEVKGSPKSKIKWPFKWGLKVGSGTEEEGSGVESETDVANAVDVPPFKFHTLPRLSLDGPGGICDTFGSSKQDTEAKDYVVSKGVRLPIVNETSRAGEKVDIMERLQMAKEKAPSVKTDRDLKISVPSTDASASAEAKDSSLARGGTFKIDNPESVLGLVAPEISTSDDNNKLSLGLSNMLGLNIKD